MKWIVEVIDWRGNIYINNSLLSKMFTFLLTFVNELKYSMVVILE